MGNTYLPIVSSTFSVSSVCFVVGLTVAIHTGGRGEESQGEPLVQEWPSSLGNIFLNAKAARTSIPHFHTIPHISQKDMFAVWGNDGNADYLANTVISWPDYHDDLIDVSLCVCSCVCVLMGIPCGIMGKLGKKTF